MAIPERPTSGPARHITAGCAVLLVMTKPGQSTPTRTSRGGAVGQIGHALRGLILLIPGISLAVTGMGLTLAFGVFAFIGIPLLILGLSLITAAIDAEE